MTEWIYQTLQSMERQNRLIEAIPEEHQPIFWWLKYHARRLNEACALMMEDFDGRVFTIRRAFSNKRLIDRTKTGKEHTIPCATAFRPFLEYMTAQKVRAASPYFFTNPYGKKEGKHYTVAELERIWNDACKMVGEEISCYPGTKHSTCSQLVNEYGYSIHEVQMVTDHARLDSVKQYAEVEVSAKQRLIDRKGGQRVVVLRKSGNISETKFGE